MGYPPRRPPDQPSFTTAVAEEVESSARTPDAWEQEAAAFSAGEERLRHREAAWLLRPAAVEPVAMQVEKAAETPAEAPAEGPAAEQGADQSQERSQPAPKKVCQAVPAWLPVSDRGTGSAGFPPGAG